MEMFPHVSPVQKEYEATSGAYGMPSVGCRKQAQNLALTS